MYLTSSIVAGTMDDDFTQIPIIDLALVKSPATKPQFLLQLRDALVRVGFFYIKNHAITADVQQKAQDQCMEFFNLSLEKKLEVETVHSKHFVGYNRMDAEKTATQVDHNESIAVEYKITMVGSQSSNSFVSSSRLDRASLHLVRMNLYISICKDRIRYFQPPSEPVFSY